MFECFKKLGSSFNFFLANKVLNTLSVAFKITYDSIYIKNTGTTFIYFKWKKVLKAFLLKKKLRLN